MMAREQLKTEIDRLDERYLELAFNILRQFPHTAPDRPRTTDGPETGKAKRAMEIAQGIC